MAWPEPTWLVNGSVANGTNNVSNPMTIAPSAPATRTGGELLILVTTSRSNSATYATPSGWNIVSGYPVRSGTASGGTIYLFTRYADNTSADNASAQWSGLTTGTSGDACKGIIIAVSWASQTLDGSLATTQDQASTTSYTVNACSPSASNSFWIGVGIRIHDTAHTNTITTLTERHDSHTTNGTGHSLEIGCKSLTASGSTGTATITPSNTTSMRTLSTAACFAAAGYGNLPAIDANAPPPLAASKGGVRG